MSLRTLRTGLLAVVVVMTVGLAPGARSQAQTAVPTCFGAPAMDPTMPCVDRLSTVTPTVAGVDDEPMTPCRALKAPAAVHVCAFGASKSRARLRLALIGDSHTFAWRAVLDQLGQSQGWRGYSLAEAACMFSEATKSLPAGPREHCLAAYRATLGWLRSHPEIDVVITTHEADTALDVPEGRTNDAKIAGFRRTWKGLPHSIKRVIVLRDTPNASRDELQCVERASASGVTAAARACAEPRSWELTKDVAVAAARGLHSARYRVVDLSDLICSPVVCHPEVGGVLINRDTTGHVTQTFARTTAPYLLRRLAPLLP